MKFVDEIHERAYNLAKVNSKIGKFKPKHEKQYKIYTYCEFETKFYKFTIFDDGDEDYGYTLFCKPLRELLLTRKHNLSISHYTTKSVFKDDKSIKDDLEEAEEILKDDLIKLNQKEKELEAIANEINDKLKQPLTKSSSVFM